MKKDVFSKIDAFDIVDLDHFDKVELDPEEKILYSDDLKKLIREEIQKVVSPIGSLIQEAVSKKLEEKNYPSVIKNNTEAVETKIDQEVSRLKSKFSSDLEKVSRELKEKYAEFRNILNSQERYTFGGFAPPNPASSSSGTFLKNTNQTWAGLQWAQGGAAIGTPVIGGHHSGLLYIDSTGLLASSDRFLMDNSNTQISFGDGSWINEAGNVASLANETPGGGVTIFADNTAGTITITGAFLSATAVQSISMTTFGQLFLSGDTVALDTDNGVVIGTSAPRGIFDIAGFYTIGNETSGSVSFTYNDSDNNGHYIAGGDSYAARIYAYYDSPVGRVYSASFYQITPQTDNGSSDPLEIHISWGAVTNASGYIVVIKDPQYMGSNYDACADVGNVTSIILGGAADTEDTFGALISFPSTVGASLYVNQTSGEMITTGPLNISTGAIATGYVDAQAVVKNPVGACAFRFEGQDYGKLEWRANHSGTTNTSAMQLYVRNDGVNPPFIHWGLLNDAENSEGTFLNCYRSGTSPTTVEWGGTQTGLSGKTSPTAKLHLPGGSTSASTAPLKFTSGTNMTTAEAGAFEYDGTNLFFTRTGTTRETTVIGNSGASAPSTTGAGTVTNRYGGATNFLGDPNSWLSFVNGGTTYKIPLYI